MVDNRYLSGREIEKLLDDLGKNEYAYVEYDELNMRLLASRFLRQPVSSLLVIRLEATRHDQRGYAQGLHVGIDGTLELPHNAFPNFDQSITLGSVALEFSGILADI